MMRVSSVRFRKTQGRTTADVQSARSVLRAETRRSHTLIAIVGLIIAAGGLEAGSQSFGSAARGRQVLSSHDCLRCHSLGGTGAGTAPDLGRRSFDTEYSPTKLAALMWNHGPEIWRDSKGEVAVTPSQTADEGDDVLAHFWSVRYFDRPGEAIRGKQVFEEKGCAGCHALAASDDRGRGGAPAVSEWQGLADPVRWAERLWNHSGEMSRLFDEQGLNWPRFSEEEMTDLLIYLQNLGPTRSLPRTLALSDSETGRAVFEAKGCVNCHTLGSANPSVARSGGSLQGFRTMTGFTAEMWNHAPEMRARGAELGMDAPRFTVDEMRAVISFVYFSGGFEERGNPSAGRSVYVKKQCASCHGEAGSFGEGPLGQGRASAARMVDAVWSHGPKMLRELESRGASWPALSARDVANLVAYLNETGG